MNVVDVGEVFHILVGCLHRAVDCVVGEIEKEWSITIGLDDTNGLTAEVIRHV